MPDSPQKDPPLVDVKVTNPVEYFKIWWNRIIGNEGVDFSLHIKPLTAIAISVAIASLSFGLGRFTLPINIPFFKLQTPSPTTISTPTPNPWKDTGFTGTLQKSTTSNKFYLIVTSSSEAINLQVPSNIDLSELSGKRIFVSGPYNKEARLLIVEDTKNLEILPKSPIPVPTISPTPIPTSTSQSTY